MLSKFGFQPGSGQQSGFVLDMSEISRNMEKLNKKIMPEKARKGLTKAGIALMNDTVTGLPTTPIKRPGYSPGANRKPGELRGSGAVFVNGKKVASSKRAHGEGATGKFQPESYGGTPIPKNSHEACVVFNAPYAAKQHEEFPNKTEPSAGRKFLKKKIYGNPRKYIGMVAQELKL